MSESFTPAHGLSKYDLGDKPGAAALNANLTKIDLRLVLPVSGGNPSPYPVGGFILRTDLKKLYQNTGTLGTPVWTIALDGAGVASTLTGSGAVQVDGDNNPHDLNSSRTISVIDASTSAKGAVQLATDGEIAAGKAVQANDSRLSDARVAPGGYGAGIYGDGSGGSMSLGGDTTLTSGNQVFYITTLTLNSHILTGADVVTILHISTLLDLGSGGRIRAVQGPAGPGPSPGGGNVNGTAGGTGGVGGTGCGCLFVYARTVTGTGTIDANGGAAPAAGAGLSGSDPGSSTGGTTGGGGSNTGALRGLSLPSGAAEGGGGGGNSALGGLAMSAAQKRVIINLLSWLHLSDNIDGSVFSMWYSLSRSGGGGSGGSRCRPGQPVTPTSAGGGAGYYAAGGASTDNNTGYTSASPCGTGGGGSGGGAGCVCIVVTDFAPSTLTVGAAGGRGGDGGNTTVAGMPGGNSGGGGSGGFALLLAQLGYTSTVTAAGGLAGTPGPLASAAAAGGAGVTMKLARSY